MAAANSRSKDRDVAPHLTQNSGRTLQPSSTTTSSRRNEPRDSAKRKVAEAGDDWRRGTYFLGTLHSPANEAIGGSDFSRSGREDRSETSRRDRDDRERARSRPRDSSKSRGEPGRRDRDREDSRRDRDEDDDPRHWRDDGKRDERMAARRARERPHGDHWEPSSDRERRWPTNDDRDSRSKRPNGRDRRPGNEEPKERDDRKDKEKEPAWMDTYVPSEPLPGILGGKSGDGELDGIQAWKKGMKDKEKQDREKASADQTANGKSNESQAPTAGAQQLDEIQLFRLMMQKEKEKRDTEQQGATPLNSSTGGLSSPAHAVSAGMGGDTSRPTDQPTVDTVPAAVDTGRQGSTSLEDQAKTQPVGAVPRVASTASLDNTSDSQFIPPPGSRLLALGRGLAKTPNVPVQAPAPIDAGSFQGVIPGRNQPSRGDSGFSPFEEQARLAASGDVQPPVNSFNPDSQQRIQMDRSPLNAQYPSHESQLADLNSNGHMTGKGSRFAKFFDAKGREQAPLKPQSPIAFASASPNLGQRPDQGGYAGPPGNHEERRTVDDLFAMLSNSQPHSGMHNPNMGGPLGLPQQNAGFNGHPNIPPHQHPHLNHNRVESLYDSRLDDRNFVPNDMVPGLRTFPPPRNREPFDPVDEPVIQLQRLAQQHQQLQQRGEPQFTGPVNALFNQQAHRSIPVQQQFRGNGNPSASLPLQNSQRFPPGLANLGNRPPHEPSQFIGLPVGAPLNGLSNNGPLPQQFNTFNNTAQFNSPQFRGGLPPVNLQGLQPSGPPLPLGSIAPNNIDPRLSNQQHFGGANIAAMGGQRGVPVNAQPRLVPHPQLGLRAQQQQQIHPQLLGHMHPPNPPSQQHPNQPAQDLIALLMGGSLRE
ncbi:hypothetical protein CC1G_03669 [Coprinopsis cinerea okayama7|uniref:Uncharacterized protein n=1 Tax=Coprinopsis cinerea (strain Okayama-7 / 130 / ATCC MYA-4618 / FGSC 9003) TaxID=240176 RepID=A8N1X6_COPC7|nr:hypothetical protein CC1G_03669 [Coprinopsis cinerea okayama7\|eukprot:XP_001828875.2 hypothetical protein CC1G_03669 [Coprinopsis cinerea okayama7\